MYIDYRALKINKMICTAPIPCIDKILDHLISSVTFSKIGLAQSHYQAWLAKGHEHRTAFQMYFGLFKYRALPFRLCNATTTFQRIIHKILQANLHVFCIMYTDDILILSRSIAVHE